MLVTRISIGVFIVISILTLRSIHEEAQVPQKRYTCLCSWYSTKESKALTASGDRLNDNLYTCATWDYPLGTKLLVRSTASPNKYVKVIVNDRGPAKRLYKKGIKIDLTKVAFSKLDKLEEGITEVTITKLNN
jgi:rare lipoprotein A